MGAVLPSLTVEDEPTARAAPLVPLETLTSHPSFRASDINQRTEALNSWFDDYVSEVRLDPSLAGPPVREEVRREGLREQVIARENLVWQTQEGTSWRRKAAKLQLDALDNILVRADQATDMETIKGLRSEYGAVVVESMRLEMAEKKKFLNRMVSAAKAKDAMDSEIQTGTRANLEDMAGAPGSFVDVEERPVMTKRGAIPEERAKILTEFGFGGEGDFQSALGDFDIQFQRFDTPVAVDSAGRVHVNHRLAVSDEVAVTKATFEVDAPAAEKMRAFDSVPRIRERAGSNLAKILNRSKLAREGQEDLIGRNEFGELEWGPHEALAFFQDRAQHDSLLNALAGGVTRGTMRLAELPFNLAHGLFGDGTFVGQVGKETARSVREERKVIEATEEFKDGGLGRTVVFEVGTAIPELIPVAKVGQGARRVFSSRAAVTGTVLGSGALIGANAQFSNSIGMGEPINKARMAALIQFGTTLLASGTFQKMGLGGTERILAGVRNSTVRAGLMKRLGQVGVQATAEGVEEAIDEFTAEVLIAQANARPGMTNAEVSHQAFVAFLVGSFIGGTVEAGAQVDDAFTPEPPPGMEARSDEELIQLSGNPELRSSEQLTDEQQEAREERVRRQGVRRDVEALSDTELEAVSDDISEDADPATVAIIEEVVAERFGDVAEASRDFGQERRRQGGDGPALPHLEPATDEEIADNADALQAWAEITVGNRERVTIPLDPAALVGAETVPTGTSAELQLTGGEVTESGQELPARARIVITGPGGETAVEEARPSDFLNGRVVRLGTEPNSEMDEGRQIGILRARARELGMGRLRNELSPEEQTEFRDTMSILETANATEGLEEFTRPVMPTARELRLDIEDDFDLAESPVISFIRESGGLLSKTRAIRSARKQGVEKEALQRLTGDYDGAVRFSPKLNSLIYTNQDGQLSERGPDQIAQQLFEEGLIPEPTPGAMWEAIRSESESAGRNKAQVRQQEANLRQDVEFQTVAQNPQSEGTEAVRASELFVGTELTIDGAAFEVSRVETDEDGNVERVIMRDGPRFGRQIVDGDTVLFVEEIEEAPLTEDDPFSLESPTEAELEGEQSDREQREAVEAGAAAPLEGDAGDLTADMFGEGDTPLFNENRAGSRSSVVGFPGMPNTPSLNNHPRASRQRISAPEVLEAIAAVLRKAGGTAPFRGRVQGRSALGEFDVKQETIAVRTSNDIPTAAHEMAHAIEKVVFGWKRGGPWTAGRIGQTRQAELMRLGKALYGSTNPTGGYKREGFAEFVRLFITDPDMARQRAPEFAKWFEANFVPQTDTAKEFAKARRLAVDFEQQDDVTYAGAQIVGGESRGRRARLAGRRAARRVSETFGVEAMVESGVQLQRFFEQAVARSSTPLEESDNPFATFTERRLTHDAITEWMATKSMVDFARNPRGPSLKEIFSMVRGKREEFMIYLWARRAMALHNEGGDRNPGLPRERAARLVSHLERQNINFPLAASKLYDWQSGVLDYVAQASPTLGAVVDRIRGKDPGAYIPLQREFDAFDGNAAARGRSANMGKLVAELKGSGRRIKDPFENILTNTRGMILMAHQRAVLEQVLTLSKNVEGMGNFMRRISRDQEVALRTDVESMIEEVRQKVEGLGGTLDVDDAGMDLASEMLTFMRPRTAPRGQQEVPILPVREGDKIVWYEVDPGLYRAIEGLDMKYLKGFANLFLGVPTRLFRMGTTAYRVAFAVITNPTRDGQTLLVNTKTSASGPRLMMEWLNMYRAAFIDAATGGKVSNEWIDLYKRLGGTMATFLGQDSRPVKRAARRLFEHPVVKFVDVRNWIDYVREVLQFGELASRATELKMLARDIGWDGGPMTVEQAQQLLIGPKQVTTDFSASGRLAGAINQGVPFFNAAIQGPRAHVRALRNDPTKFFTRVGMLMAATIGNWFRNKDEEWWKDLRAGDKYRYTHIPVELNGRKEVIRLARPFEVGGIFMAFPEAILDSWYEQDPRSAKEWAQEFLKHSVPAPIPNFSGQGFPIDTTAVEPVLIREALDQFGNRDRFFDSPIVPVNLQNAPEAEQFTGYTTRLSIELGRMFDVSPIRIDHAIRGIGGGASLDLAAWLGGRAEPRTDREKELADLPIVGVLFSRGGEVVMRSEAVHDFYEHLDFVKTREQSIRQPETAEEKEMRLQMSDASRALSLIARVLREEDSKDKRQELARLRTKIAREANEAFDNNEVVRRRFSEWKKAAMKIERASKKDD